jgi:predicted phage-related endonuclease
MIERIAPVAIHAENNSAEWQRERQKGVGASDVPTILGMSNWSEARALFYEKRGELVAGTDSAYVNYGHWFEPGLVAAFEHHQGRPVARYPVPAHHRGDNPRHMATPDAEVDHETGLEIKCVEPRSPVWQYPYNEVPDAVFVQCQWQAYVMGWDRVFVQAAIGLYDSRTLLVDRDDAVIASLIEAVDDFLRRVDQNDPPDWQGGPDVEVLSRRYREFTGEILQLDDDQADIWERYEAARRDAKDASERADRARGEILELLGNADAAELPDGSFIRRKINRAGNLDLRKVKRL